MTRPGGLVWLWAAALAALAGGLVLTATAPAYEKESRRRMERCGDEHRILDELQQERRRRAEVVRGIEAFPDDRPAPLGALIRSTVPTADPQMRQTAAQAVNAAWTCRAMNVALREIRYEDVGRLLVALEANQPPWRLTAISIRAGLQDDTAQGVTLTVEGLERSRSRP